MDDEYSIDDVDIKEQLFHNAVREYVITGLLFCLLYITSFAILAKLRKRLDTEDYFSGQDEDAIVYRISVSISIGAVLLLPISIISNEILLMYPNSYYVQWLNSSLIQGIWNNIFFLSNLSLFFLLPFAYLFTESEGFTGSQKGVWARVYETATVLCLLTVLVVGIVWVASAMLGADDEASKQTLFDIWHLHLPFLYSCISFFGVASLLVCTPAGFTHLFTLAGALLLTPGRYGSVDAQLAVARCEEEVARQRLRDYCMQQVPLNGNLRRRDRTPAKIGAAGATLANGVVSDEAELERVVHRRLSLERQSRQSNCRRNLCYPLTILLVMTLTSACLLMIVLNTLELLVGHKTLLPVAGKEMVLGETSLSMFGLYGAAAEVVLIVYVTFVSVIGFYRLPYLGARLLPRPYGTSLTQLIGNAVVVLVLSTAMPVLSRIVGLTNFDLLGNYSRLEWIGSLGLVLVYNLAFGSLTALCLANLVTRTLRTELIARLHTAYRHMLLTSQRAYDRAATAIATLGGGRHASPPPPTLVNLNNSNMDESGYEHETQHAGDSNAADDVGCKDQAAAASSINGKVVSTSNGGDRIHTITDDEITEQRLE